MCAALKPATSRLIVAGSMRRRKLMVGDVEILFVPCVVKVHADLFADTTASLIEEMKRNHPDADIEGHVFISSPPEGGIPFHRAEFREAVRAAIALYKPDLVVLDPWSQVATEDAAKEVVDKLAEIRSCFPEGDACPCLLIVAHTKKPRPEDVRKGRGLT